MASNCCNAQTKRNKEKQLYCVACRKLCEKKGK